MSAAARPKLHLEILDEAQRRLLLELTDFAESHDFYLAGGTALALRLGHRRSVDFDWFRALDFDPIELARELQKTITHDAISTAPGTLHTLIAGVRVTFLAYDYPLLEPVETAAEPPVPLASLDDLATMKLAAVLQRGERKDLYDLDVLLLDHRNLAELIGGFERKYGFDGTVSLLRALAYFDEADATPDPELLDERLSWTQTRRRLTEAVRSFASDNQ